MTPDQSRPPAPPWLRGRDEDTFRSHDRPPHQRPEAPYVTGLPPQLMTDLERQQQQEIERLRRQIDNCQANSHYRAWQESQADLTRTRTTLLSQLAQAQQQTELAWAQRDRYLEELQHDRFEIDKLLKTLAVADVLVEQAHLKDAVVEAARALMQSAVKGDLLLVSTSNGNIYTELQADLAVAFQALDATEPDNASNKPQDEAERP